MNRRKMLSVLAATGIGSAVFHRAVVALADETKELSIANLQQAEWITGVKLSDEDRTEILKSIESNQKQNELLRKVELTYDIAPAIHFSTVARDQARANVNRNVNPVESAVGKLPETDEEIAFLPVTELSALIRNRMLSSRRLTTIYLDRLKKYGPMLRCVVNLTEELAIQQADQADKEIAAGKYRGPLHGIPWGAKDLISVPGYPTTWGIPQHRDRILNEKATVAARLESAGAVLVAKLSLGAIAMGDKWFGGLTRNPWNVRGGSSGSSAGSASATVAGLVGFSLGSETLGSILSPSIRCGASGLRPTFGRVSRHGCMPLSWSMDKIGPICRSIEDSALVFGAIHGADGLDATASDFHYQWPTSTEVRGMKVGYSKGRRNLAVEDREDLKVLRELGCELVEMELPRDIPIRAMTTIIDIEGASVFDDLLRVDDTDGWNAWRGIFQSAQYVSAIDYLRFQRVRTKLMHQFEETIKDVDILFNMSDLMHTNFTGHPSAVIPIGYRKRGDGRAPIPAVFTGHLNQDAKVLTLAHAYQSMVDAHLQHPPLDQWLEKFNDGSLDEKEEDEDEAAESAKQTNPADKKKRDGGKL